MFFGSLCFGPGALGKCLTGVIFFFFPLAVTRFLSCVLRKLFFLKAILIYVKVKGHSNQTKTKKSKLILLSQFCSDFIV